jgi:hypothetical protein
MKGVYIANFFFIYVIALHWFGIFSSVEDNINNSDCTLNNSLLVINNTGKALIVFKGTNGTSTLIGVIPARNGRFRLERRDDTFSQLPVLQLSNIRPANNALSKTLPDNFNIESQKNIMINSEATYIPRIRHKLSSINFSLKGSCLETSVSEPHKQQFCIRSKTATDQHS